MKGRQMHATLTKAKQRGTALVIALVLLAAVTLLAVAAVQTSVMEMRMAGSDEARMHAFQGADSAVDFVIRDFGTYQDELSTQLELCIHDTGDSSCDDFASETLFDLKVDSDGNPVDTLEVTLHKLGECLPPPRIEAATSVTEFARHDFVIESRLDKTGSGGGRTHLWRGYMMLAAGGGC